MYFLKGRFEKVDFKFKKATLDLGFLFYCRNNNLIPTFLKFKLANKTLANSDVYKSCQQKLQKEIDEKKRVINEHKNQDYKVLTQIKRQVNPADFAHISSIFFIFNDKNKRKCKKVQDLKILKLVKNSLSINNPDIGIYNFSCVTLSDSDKSLLSKCLNFVLPHASLEYSEYLVDYELLFRDTLSLETFHLDRVLLESRLRA